MQNQEPVGQSSGGRQGYGQQRNSPRAYAASKQVSCDRKKSSKDGDSGSRDDQRAAENLEQQGVQVERPGR